MASKKHPRDIGKLLAIAGLSVTIIAVIVSVAIYFSQRGDKNILIEAQVVSDEELTLYAPEQELSVRFTYAGEEVKHLWKQVIRFQNAKARTVVGTGKMMNIIGDGISFSFPSGTRLLKMQKTEDNFGASVVQSGPNRFQIQFSQWRQDEYLVETFYIASDVPLDKKPLPTYVSRDIIDGDARIIDFARLGSKGRRFLIDSFPLNLVLVGKILGIIVLLLLIFAIVFILTDLWKDYFELYPAYHKWKKEYRAKFIELLNSKKLNLSSETIALCKKEPNFFDDSVWKKFKMKRPPMKPDFASPLQGLGISLLALPVFYGIIALALSIIPS